MNYFKNLKSNYSGFLAILLILIFLLTSIAVMAEQNSSSDPYQIIQQIKIPKDYNQIDPIILSPDGSNVYSIFHNTQKMDVPGGKLLSFMSPLVHPDTTQDVPNQAILMMNNQIISPSSAMTIFPPNFSNDMKNISYTYQYHKNKLLDPNKCGLIINNKEVLSTIKDTALPYEVTYSPNGIKTAIVVDSGNILNPPKASAYLLVNGNKISSDFQMIHSPVFNSDGSQVAYWAGNNFSLLGGYKECCIMVNDQNISSTLRWVSCPKFSANDKLTYAAGDGKKKWIIYDGKKISPDLDNIMDLNDITGLINNSFIFSPDSKRIAYIGKLDSKWNLWVNDQKLSPDSDEVGKPVFSQDGSKIAYKMRNSDKKWVIMLNDKQFSPEYDAIAGDPLFNQDGTKIAYTASLNNKWFVMVNNNKISLDYDCATKIQKGEYTYLNPGVNKESKITLLGFAPDAKSLIFKVEYQVQFFSDGSKMPIQTVIMINERLVSPTSNNFVILDQKISKTGIYFVGYNLTYDYSMRGVGTQTEERYTQIISGDILHGLVNYK